ncbi:hypothetical protein KN815_34750 [Streptomyces sp. 4503]|uniref:Uncharacterized protein n=1 Tax=Streptomyces niphimycinicus TaxID=2842201 RepID=A0ABS6CQ65_9ACTN|nr:hypothetical protein [Streptomyces niphimycinicus]MBU3869028.1 hypothetical protein [Streptomyces niphimycinicus]
MVDRQRDPQLPQFLRRQLLQQGLQVTCHRCACLAQPGQFDVGNRRVAPHAGYLPQIQQLSDVVHAFHLLGEVEGRVEHRESGRVFIGGGATGEPAQRRRPSVDRPQHQAGIFEPLRH